MEKIGKETEEDIHYLIKAHWFGYSYKSHQDFQIKLHKLAIKYNYKEIVKTLKENNIKHYFKLLL